MTDATAMLERDFALLPDLIAAHARDRGDKTAIADDARAIDYATLDRLMDRVAAALQRDGTAQRQAVAIVAYPSSEYAAVYLGALRAGSVAAPIAPSATPAQIAAMIADSGATLVFLDETNERALAGQPLAARQVRLERLDDWLSPEGTKPRR